MHVGRAGTWAAAPWERPQTQTWERLRAPQQPWAGPEQTWAARLLTQMRQQTWAELAVQRESNLAPQTVAAPWALARPCPGT